MKTPEPAFRFSTLDREVVDAASYDRLAEAFVAQLDGLDELSQWLHACGYHGMAKDLDAFLQSARSLCGGGE